MDDSYHTALPGVGYEFGYGMKISYDHLSLLAWVLSLILYYQKTLKWNLPYDTTAFNEGNPPMLEI